jgi:hypothetical protein
MKEMHTERSEKFVKLMTGPSGRIGRIVLGLLILGLGQLVVRGTPGLVMSLVSLVPVSGGVFDFCLIAKALGYPLGGNAIRRQLSTAKVAQGNRSRA